MIELIEIDENTDPAQLKKLYRKKAMTGGGYLELKAGLGEEQLHLIFLRFLPEISSGNLAEQVLSLLARAAPAGGNLRRELAAIGNSAVARALEQTALPAAETDPEQLRRIYFSSCGPDKQSVAARLELALSRHTPADIRARLAEDQRPEIRFHARSR